MLCHSMVAVITGIAPLRKHLSFRISPQQEVYKNTFKGVLLEVSVCHSSNMIQMKCRKATLKFKMRTNLDDFYAVTTHSTRHFYHTHTSIHYIQLYLMHIKFHVCNDHPFRNSPLTIILYSIYFLYISDCKL